MKKFLSTFVFVALCVFTLNSHEEHFVNVENQEEYCKEFADRGAEAEWGSGETTVFSDYYNSYQEWYKICMSAHGQ